MCVGLLEGATYIFDLDADPWNTIKKPSIKPTRIEYAHEIARCSSHILVSSGGVPRIPKTANWSLTKCIEWLQEHPLTDEQDIVFLKNKVQQLKVLISSAAQEERQREGEAGQLTGHWRGPIPYMRLIMCLTQDYDIKAAFLWRVDARSRQELDASNLSDHRLSLR